ncbi:MAG: penicillin-binding transpeptidase domain-containing protein [Minisyncoccia bacterium]
MFTRKIRKIAKGGFYKNRKKDIDPDEIFLDSTNLPNFNVHQFEGRIEKSISIRTIVFLVSFFCIIFFLFIFRVGDLQISKGKMYFTRSENNIMRNTLIFAKRGVISDRNDVKLAWNTENKNNPEFADRKYINTSGLSILLGYLKYPLKDKYGFYYSNAFVGKDGVEKFYDKELSGENGIRIVEVDALGKKQSENVIKPPVDGDSLKLSIDSRIQSKFYDLISSLAHRVGFSGGAGVIMDVHTGEILAMTSFPEYSSQILTDGDNSAINKYLKDSNKPFLDRVLDGLYAPGSIVKPYMAMAALNEKIIDPLTNILGTAYITVANPYDPAHPSIFKDWKAQGYVDMRHAIAVSSDVYFYEIGGGYEKQKGLGIANIERYMKEFGFGSAIPSDFFNSVSGTIPSPEWKALNFNGEKWNIGNTYHTSIGQYGFQVSLIQVIRAVASIANYGTLLSPTIILGDTSEIKNLKKLDFNYDYYKIVKEGMRLSVTEGVAMGLNTKDVEIAAKTGTAELGVYKQFVNSWVTGFFPYDNPKYAFAVIMEKGPVKNTTGGVFVMRGLIDWMAVNTPEYLK